MAYFQDPFETANQLVCLVMATPLLLSRNEASLSDSVGDMKAN